MKAAKLGVALRGDRNQCPGCSEFFNSTNAFEKHRAGDHGIDRHCLSVAAMEIKGMHKGADGFWRGSVMPSKLYEEQA